jgi:hypothetical protein
LMSEKFSKHFSTKFSERSRGCLLEAFCGSFGVK